MLAWSEGADNDPRKPKSRSYDVIVGGELFTDYSDHPRKLVTLNPKTQINRRRTHQLLSRWWDARGNGLKDFSPKIRAAACSRLRSVALYLWLIVVISVRQSTVQQYLGFTAGRWLWSVRAHKADSLIAKFKAGGTVREIDMWAGVTAIISALVICHRLPVMGC